ncbi:MAG: GTPase Era [Bacteroidia bacterium]|nr:GTPase Era [Bacteroidia bacterium]
MDNINYPESHKSGFVSIVGKPNVGKSTLLNALLDQKLCIVTPKASTTRHRIYGILNEPAVQIIFTDTPGYIKKTYNLHHAMMHDFSIALEDSEIVLLVVDPDEHFPEQELFEQLLKHKSHIFLVINKIDLYSKQKVEDKIAAVSKILPIAKVFRVSAIQKTGLEEIKNAVIDTLPEGPPYFDKQAISDKPERFFVAEFVREQLFLNLHEELPYSCEVYITTFKPDGNKIFIDAEIHVDKKSHKGMIIGKQGQMIKVIRKAAQAEIEAFLGTPVYLSLYVRITEDWRQSRFRLSQFGYVLPKQL